MKSKIVILCSLPAILFSMVACCVQHCKGFPEELTDYLPYKQGQIITFVNERNDTLSMQVQNTWKTNPYIEKACKGACEPPSYGFNIYPIDTNYQTVTFSLTDWSVIDKYHGFDFHFAFYPTGHIHAITMEATNTIIGVNSDENDPISNVEIIRGKGIISFTDKNLNCTWKLSENY